MPHQGIVALSISLFSVVLTLSILAYNLRHEKKQQSQNTSDEH